MAIDIRKYINITSGVGGGAGVKERSFMLRLYTSNSKIGANTLEEFTSAADVATFFGSTSTEYEMSALYFSFVSKSISQPKAISFYGWDKTNDTVTACLDKSVNLSTNFGSFTFIDTLTAAETVEAATWNSTYNVDFIYLPVIGHSANIIGSISSTTLTVESVTAGTVEIGQTITGAGVAADTVITAGSGNTWTVSVSQTISSEALELREVSPQLQGFAGTCLTLEGAGYQRLAPAMVLAATDYNKRNSVQNYMFQQFPTLTPTVTTDVDSTFYDSLLVNYIGQTQTAGQDIAFYQRGNLCGGATDPRALNTYANEMWLKDAMSSQLLSLLLSLPKVDTGTQGQGQITATLQSVVQKALYNGTISIGKSLSAVQILDITNLTGDDKAYLKVQNNGFWFNVSISSSVVNGVTEYKAEYLLIYAKDDAIRGVNGTHVLI